MKIAIKEAKKSLKDSEWPGGAVIVKNGKVLAKAANHVQRNFDPTAHAEILAIRKLSKKLKKSSFESCDLYTTVEPCPMCMAACIWSGIAKVYYGASLEDFIDKGDHQIKIYSDEIAKKSFRPIKIIGGILRNECLKLY